MAFRGRRAAAGSVVNSILTSHNGNQFTDGARACWSLGSTHSVSTSPLWLAPQRTLFSPVFGQGWRGPVVRSVKKLRFWSSSLIQMAEIAAHAWSEAAGGPEARREGAFARGCRHWRVTAPSSEATERATPPSPFARRNQRNRRIGTSKIRPAGIASPAVSHTPCTWRDRWRSVPQQGVDPVRMHSAHLRVVSRNASEVPARIHCRAGIRHARS